MVMKVMVIKVMRLMVKLSLMLSFFGYEEVGDRSMVKSNRNDRKNLKAANYL